MAWANWIGLFTWGDLLTVYSGNYDTSFMNQASVICHAYRLISCSLILVAIPFCICPASVQYNKKKLTRYTKSYTFIQKLSVWSHIIEGLNMTIWHVFKYGICDLSGIDAQKEVIKNLDQVGAQTSKLTPYLVCLFRIFNFGLKILLISVGPMQGNGFDWGKMKPKLREFLRP